MIWYYECYGIWRNETADERRWTQICCIGSAILSIRNTPLSTQRSQNFGSYHEISARRKIRFWGTSVASIALQRRWFNIYIVINIRRNLSPCNLPTHDKQRTKRTTTNSRLMNKTIDPELWPAISLYPDTKPCAKHWYPQATGRSPCRSTSRGRRWSHSSSCGMMLTEDRRVFEMAEMERDNEIRAT